MRGQTQGSRSSESAKINPNYGQPAGDLLDSYTDSPRTRPSLSRRPGNLQRNSILANTRRQMNKHNKQAMGTIHSMNRSVDSHFKSMKSHRASLNHSLGSVCSNMNRTMKTHQRDMLKSINSMQSITEKACHKINTTFSNANMKTNKKYSQYSKQISNNITNSFTGINQSLQSLNTKINDLSRNISSKMANVTNVLQTSFKESSQRYRARLQETMKQMQNIENSAIQANNAMQQSLQSASNAIIRQVGSLGVGQGLLSTLSNISAGIASNTRSIKSSPMSVANPAIIPTVAPQVSSHGTPQATPQGAPTPASAPGKDFNGLNPMVLEVDPVTGRRLVKINPKLRGTEWEAIASRLTYQHVSNQKAVDEARAAGHLNVTSDGWDVTGRLNPDGTGQALARAAPGVADMFLCEHNGTVYKIDPIVW